MLHALVTYTGDRTLLQSHRGTLLIKKKKNVIQKRQKEKKFPGLMS